MESNLVEVLLARNGFNTKVAGTTFENRQDAIDASLADVGVLLLREYGNPHDEFAIQVLRADDGRQVGYIKADYSRHLAPFTKYQELSAIVTNITGVGEGKAKGVNIYVYEDDGRVLPTTGFMLGKNGGSNE
jgi:single-stranded-DNA-specific exonuclease